jgi:tetratricopeptide (TPR) repeat protein/predicted Zn-dependent protease
LALILLLALTACSRNILSPAPVSTATPTSSEAGTAYPGKIIVMPVGPLDEKTTLEVTTAIGQLEDLFRHNMELVQPVPIPPSAYNPARGRYHALVLLREIEKKAPEDALFTVALTAKGLYSEGQENLLLDLKLGSRVPVIVSLAPLSGSGNLPQRLKALLGEAVARAMGVPFSVASCPFGRSVTPLDLDRKGPSLCKNCEELLPLLLPEWIFSRRSLDEKLAAGYRKVSGSSTDPWVHLYLSSLYAFFKMGKPAADELKTAADLASSDSLARFETAWGALYLGDPAAASSAFSSLIKEKIMVPESMEGKAECALAGKKYGEALNSYQQLLKAFPDYYGRALVLKKIGEISLGQKNYARAEEALKGSLKLNPGDLDARIGLGEIYLLSKKPEKAAALFREVQKEDPANEKNRLGLAYALQSMKKYEEAIRELAELLYSSRYRADALYETAFSLAGLKKYDEAVNNLQTLINEFPSFSGLGRAHQLYGDIMMEQKNLARAEEEYRLALKSNSRNAAVLSGLGRLMALKSMDAEALEYLNRAVTLAPADVEALYALGIVYEKTGKKEEAVSTFRKVLRLNPLEYRSNFELGNIHLKSKNFRAAADYFKTVLKTKPDSREALIQLAIAYESMEMFAEERNVLERFVPLAQGQSEFQKQVEWASERLQKLPAKK